jgi:hypothetical protein
LSVVVAEEQRLSVVVVVQNLQEMVEGEQETSVPEKTLTDCH